MTSFLPDPGGRPTKGFVGLSVTVWGAVWPLCGYVWPYCGSVGAWMCLQAFTLFSPVSTPSSAQLFHALFTPVTTPLITHTIRLDSCHTLTACSLFVNPHSDLATLLFFSSPCSTLEMSWFLALRLYKV